MTEGWWSQRLEPPCSTWARRMGSELKAISKCWVAMLPSGRLADTYGIHLSSTNFSTMSKVLFALSLTLFAAYVYVSELSSGENVDCQLTKIGILCEADMIAVYIDSFDELEAIH